MVYLFFAGWLACGFVTTGIVYADGQRGCPLTAKEDRRTHAGYAVMMGLGGPVGLIVAYLFSGFAQHGWKLIGTK